MFDWLTPNILKAHHPPKVGLKREEAAPLATRWGLKAHHPPKVGLKLRDWY